MARNFKILERAPHRPNRCVVTGLTGSKDNPLIDLDAQIDYYGMVYLSYSIFAAIADQLGYVSPNEASVLRSENVEMRKKLDRLPTVTERLVNDIRDLSISAVADLLSDFTPVVLADDKEPEQSNAGASDDYGRDDNPLKPNSEPPGIKGPSGVSTDSVSKPVRSNPRTTSSGNR